MIECTCLNSNRLGLLLGTVMHGVRSQILAESPTLTLVQASRPLTSISKHFRDTAHLYAPNVPQVAT